jgi:hypothetical protein
VTACAIEILPLDQLRPWTRNARTHSRKQIRQIAESIRRFGFTNPVLIDGENRILAGHGRVEAARELGMATAPCLRIDHMSATDKRAYVLADNKLALNAGWDEELLALELKELMEADIDFGVDITGFSIAEVDQLIGALRLRSRAIRRMTAFRSRKASHRVASPAICGSLGRTTSSVATRSIPESSPISSIAKRPRWSSPIRPIMSRSTAMSAGLAKSATRSSRWRPAR